MNLDNIHYSTEAERCLKDEQPISIRSVYVKSAKAKQKPSLKQLGAWHKARIVQKDGDRLSIRIFNTDEEPLEISSLAITFTKDDEEALFCWGTMDTPFVTIKPRGNIIIVYKPKAAFLNSIKAGA